MGLSHSSERDQTCKLTDNDLQKTKMTKSLNVIDGQGGEICKNDKRSKCEKTLNKEESKLDLPEVSGHLTFKAEGGLIP